MPRLNPGGPLGLARAAKLETAYKMRIDGKTLNAISEVTGINKGDLSREFRKQVARVSKEGGEALHALQNERALEVLASANEIHRRFIPVLDNKGLPVMEPAYDGNGQPLLDENGQQVVLPKRDEAQRIQALNTSIKAISQISELNGLTGAAAAPPPVFDFEVNFNVVDTGPKHPLFEDLNPTEVEIVVQYIRDNGLGGAT